MADQEDCELRVEERWLADRFGRLLGDIRRRADAAPPALAVDTIERMLLKDGRELLRQAAEQEIQYQADAAEKKGRATARRAGKGGTKG